MKKSKNRSIGLLAAVAVALIAHSARAQGTLSYSTGDLLLGFEKSGVTANYVIDLGPASYILGLSGSTNLTTALSLGNIAADLSGTFGGGWATTGSVGTNVQWGVIGGTSKTSNGLFGLPKNTILLTLGELNVGTHSAAPQTYSNSAQLGINNQIQSLGAAINNLTVTANSTKAAWDSSGTWSSDAPSSGAFGLTYGIEQPASGTYIGPANSVLDLYELQPSLTGTGIYEGSFSLDSSGNLSYIAAVPEPSTFASIGAGAAFLALFRRSRKLQHA